MKEFVLGVLLCVGSGQAFAYSVDEDVPPAVSRQMKADLDLMRQIRGKQTSPLHREIFGTMNGENYLRYFVARVTEIGMSTCGGGKAVACVNTLMDPSKMWLTQNYIQFSHPQIARLMIMFHEARHTESQKGNWTHALCPEHFSLRSIWTGNDLAGEPACDITPYGSYGSSAILLKNISKGCSNCSQKLKLDAALYAEDQFGRITDPAAREKMIRDGFSRH